MAGWHIYDDHITIFIIQLPSKRNTKIPNSLIYHNKNQRKLHYLINGFRDLNQVVSH